MTGFIITGFNFFGDLFESLPNFIGAMVISILCGLIIGLERESRGKPAGARTLVLICLGSAMFSQLSIFIAGNYGDPARIAAQVVSGIGFLGAGAILHQSEKGYIAGLTTAASIWVTAAIGMMVGANRYFFSFVGVGFVVLSLRALRLLEGYLFYSRNIEKRRVLFDPKSGKTEWMLIGLLEDNMITPSEYRFLSADDGKKVLELKYCRTNRNHRSFLSEIAVLPSVLSISEGEKLSTS